MITHAGDMSNLILDPDLDSRYLMDATLLGLPQTQDRLATVTAYGTRILAGGIASLLTPAGGAGGFTPASSPRPTCCGSPAVSRPH